MLSLKISQILLCIIGTLSVLTLHAQTKVSGEQSGIWTKANSPYLIDNGNVTVPTGKTLTIQPGVQIISRNYTDLFQVNGTLIAKGTATDSIRFSGIANDQNPNSTSGGRISFESTSTNSVLDYISINKWGDKNYHGTALTINAPLINISNSSIRNSGRIGIDIRENATKQVSILNSEVKNSGSTGINISPSINPVINNVKFSGNTKNIVAYPSGLAGLVNCDNTDIYLVNENISSATVIPKPGKNSYYILQGGFTVSANQILTISPGVEIRSLNYTDAILINGTLLAKGNQTDSIRFTGFPNPANTSSTQGGRISFERESNNSILEYVSINKWGDKNYYGNALSIGCATFNISHSNIRNSGNFAIDILGAATNKIIINDNRFVSNLGGGINITQSLAPIISNNVFSGNGKAIQAYPNSVSGISGCNNSDVHLVNSTIDGTATIPVAGSGAYYVLQGGFSLQKNANLIIKPGVEIRSRNYSDRILIEGTLTAEGTVTDSIRFKGLPNPTNANSTQGGNLDFQPGSENSKLKFVSIDKWGDKNYFGNAITLNSGNLSITNSSIRNSGNIGINIQSSASPIVSDNTFGGNPKDISSSPSGLTGVSKNKNAAIYLSNDNNTSPATLNQPGAGSFYVLQGGFTIPAKTTLTIKPGVEIRSYSYNDVITVKGTLLAEGTALDSIRFKGFQNPAIANSTHGGTINFENTAEQSVLKYVVIDQWGDKNYYGNAVGINTSSITISNSQIRNSGTTGINIISGITPVINNNTFTNNPKSILTYLSGLNHISSNKNAGIFIQKDNLSTSTTVAKPGTGSYYMLQGGFTILPNVNLTLQPGVEIRSASYSDLIQVQGSLIAIGTPADSIRFTGLPNPANVSSTHGGNITFDANSSGSSLKYVSINNWGDKNYYGAAVHINTQGINFINSTIQGSGTKAIEIAEGISPSIKENDFYNNPIAIGVGSMSLGAILQNKNAKISVRGGTINANTSWPNPGINSHYALSSQIYVQAANVLTIEAGTLVDFGNDGGQLHIDGTLSAVGSKEGVINFTRLNRQTNNAGGRVYLGESSSNSNLSYVNFDYMGSTNYSYPSLTIATSDVVVDHIKISNSPQTGLEFLASGSPVITNSDFFNNSTAILVRRGKPVFSNCNIYGNALFGINNQSNIATDIADARNSYWGDESGPLHSVTNPAGKGNKVSDKVLFNPFKTIPEDGTIRDLSVTAITTPFTNCNLTASDTVRIAITNYGNSVQTTFPVSYKINNSTPVTEILSGVSLAPGKVINYTFKTKADLSVKGNYQLKAFVSLTGDKNQLNDSIQLVIQHLPDLNAPANLIPANNTPDVDLPGRLSWAAVEGASGYDLYVWKDTDPMPGQPFVANLVQIFYDLSPQSLSFSTNYKWKIVAVRASCRSESTIHLFSTRKLPDLTISSINVPAKATSETNIEIDWKVKNQGAGGTGTNIWDDVVYFCDQPDLASSTQSYLIGKVQNFSALPAGQTYLSNKLSFNIPQGAQGNYYVIVQTNNRQNFREISTENNSLVSTAINVSLAPPPDLQVTKVIASPLTVFSGDSVSVSYTIKNMGTGPTTAAGWNDILFLNNAETLNPATDLQLKTLPHTQPLLRNAEYTIHTKVKLPVHINGTFYVHVLADGRNQVFEYNKEDNNLLTALPLTVIRRPAANLVAKSFTTFADSVTVNQPVNVRWTILNNGAVEAKAPWTDRIYLSATPVFNLNQAIPVGAYLSTAPLPSLGSYEGTLAINMPAQINPGTYYLFVKTNANNEVEENNEVADNLLTAQGPVKLLHPDLQAGNLTASAGIASELPLTMQWTVTNSSRSGIYNGVWKDKIYLSDDQTFDPSKDILLSQTDINTSLNRGASYQKNSTAKMPAGISGKKHLILVTNADRSLPESNESNNMTIVPINITLSPWADLKPISITTPASDTAGTQMAIKYRVANNGIAAINNMQWTDKIYLSPTKDTTAASMIHMTSLAQTRTLAAGATYEQQASLYLPSGFAQGKYYLVVKTNDQHSVFENKDTGNNSLIGDAINVINQPAIDLSVISGEPVTTDITAGKPAEIKWVVKNNSNIATLIPRWKDAVYISNDAVLDAGDRLLTSVLIEKVLGAGASYTQTAKVNIPQDAGSTIYFLVVADEGNLNLDNKRGNNILSLSRAGTGQPIPVIFPSPVDLIPLAFNADSKVMAAQPIDVSFTIRNSGKGNIGNTPWVDHIYLSTSSEIAGSRLLGSFPRHEPLKTLSSYTTTNRVFLPPDISGNFILIIKTDAGNSIFEREAEDNNTLTRNLQVIPQQPSDLIVKNIGILTGNNILGDSSSVSWTLHNTGTNTASGYLKDAVYFSRDSVLDPGDILFGTLEKNTYLPPKTTEFRSMRQPLTGLIPGDYYVLVKTDLQNNIVEQNESNNIAVSADKLSASVKQLLFNSPTANTLKNTTPIYYRLDVSGAQVGETLSIKLNGDSVHNAINRIFIKKDTIPNPNSYHYAGLVPFKANQELIVPALSAGIYYIMVTGNNGENTKQSIGLLAKTIPFSIAAIDAATGGNTGQVTIKITGARFEQGMKVKLTGASTYFASSVYYIDPSKVFATFDLNKAQLGIYDVSLEKPNGASTQKMKGFQVITGTPGGSSGASQLFTCRIQNMGFDESIKLDVVHPESVRRNQNVKMTIAYINGGNVDIPVQTRVLLSMEGAPINFSPNFTKQLKELFLEFKEDDGPPGILRAGTSGFINIYTFSSAPMSFEITR